MGPWFVRERVVEQVFEAYSRRTGISKVPAGHYHEPDRATYVTANVCPGLGRRQQPRHSRRSRKGRHSVAHIHKYGPDPYTMHDPFFLLLEAPGAPMRRSSLLPPAAPVPAEIRSRADSGQLRPTVDGSLRRRGSARAPNARSPLRSSALQTRPSARHHDPTGPTDPRPLIPGVHQRRGDGAHSVHTRSDQRAPSHALHTARRAPPLRRSRSHIGAPAT